MPEAFLVRLFMEGDGYKYPTLGKISVFVQSIKSEDQWKAYGVLNLKSGFKARG